MLTASHVRVSRNGVAPCRVLNRRPSVARTSASAPFSSGSNSNTATAFSITASAAASALLAKVAALLASGVSPGALPAVLHPSSSVQEHHAASTFRSALTGKSPRQVGAVANAPAPATQSSTSVVALPTEWLVITTATEWFDQHRRAAAAGALVATVFISDAAALAHAPILERLRRNFGAGPDASVRFVFVRIGDDYRRRHRVCAAAAACLARGNGNLTLGRVSHTAALHGLDVALTSFLPGGVRAFPSLLLTAGPAGAAGGGAAEAATPWSWSAATRVSELTQLVSDWAFISDRRRQLHRRRQQLENPPWQQQEEVGVEEERGVLVRPPAQGGVRRAVARTGRWSGDAAAKKVLVAA